MDNDRQAAEAPHTLPDAVERLTVEQWQFLQEYRKLNDNDKARIEERIAAMLEEYDRKAAKVYSLTEHRHRAKERPGEAGK